MVRRRSTPAWSWPRCRATLTEDCVRWASSSIWEHLNSVPVRRRTGPSARCRHLGLLQRRFQLQLRPPLHPERAPTARSRCLACAAGRFARITTAAKASGSATTPARHPAVRTSGSCLRQRADHLGLYVRRLGSHGQLLLQRPMVQLRRLHAIIGLEPSAAALAPTNRGSRSLCTPSSGRPDEPVARSSLDRVARAYRTRARSRR